MPRIIVRPALATLLIHGLLLLSLTLNWGVQDREVVKAKPAPTVITLASWMPVNSSRSRSRSR